MELTPYRYRNSATEWKSDLHTADEENRTEPLIITANNPSCCRELSPWMVAITKRILHECSCIIEFIKLVEKKIGGLSSILSLFGNKFIFNNTEA